MRKNIAAGNWKMNLNFEEAISLSTDIANSDIPLGVEVILGVPSLYLNKIKAIASDNHNVHVAAQNCHQKESGAYTGEISAPMIASIGIPYVIIGHSERRAYFNDTNEVLKEKLDVVLNQGLKTIFCCGEPLSIRQKGSHVEYVIDQLVNTIFQLEEKHLKNIILAYEPIWAIGTGETASADQAQEMHSEIRESIAKRFNNDVAENISILYGGSVKPSNAKELFNKKDVDGGLVGGASLKAEDFIGIINSF